MYLETSLLLTDLILPIMMIGCGMYFSKLKPKLDEGGFGFRTERSTKNRMTWKYAHKCCGRLWVKYGWASLMMTVGILVPTIAMGASLSKFSMMSAMMMCVSGAMLLLGFLQTERALSNQFDEEGNLKSRNR